MQLFLAKLPELFRSMNRSYGEISIEHSMIPFRPIDVTTVMGTRQWSVIDVVTATNTVTGERIQFKVELIDVLVPSSSGYMVKGVPRRFVDLYEMSKGWHFEEGDEKTGKVQDVDAKKSVKFLPDTSLGESANFYKFCVKAGKVGVAKGSKFVPISVFLRALTGRSYKSLLSEIGTTNKYLTAAFSLPEYTRIECVDKVNALFPRGGDSRFTNVQDIGKTVTLVNKFIGESALIGNGAERAQAQFSFGTLRNCFLAHPLHLGDRTLPSGTKLTSELLMEIEYSPVDILYCKTPGTRKLYVFKKYEVYNFRGLNRGATDSLTQLKAAENRGELEYTLSTGEKLRRLHPPIFNTEKVIFNVLNLYVNFLNGYEVDSNVYEMTNQSVISMEQDVCGAVAERLAIINQKASELSVQDTFLFTVKHLPLKLSPFSKQDLVEKYSKLKGKATALSTNENGVAAVSQCRTVAKDVSHAQGEMTIVQDTFVGRTDPFDAPENKNAGIVQNRTILAKTSPNTQLLAPYVQVSKCKIVSDVVYLSAEAERDQYIGEWNEDFTKDVTVARYNGIFMMVHPSRLNYIEASCFQHASPARAMSPFMECMAGKRATMSSSQARQAIAIVGAERPLVNSGAESIMWAEEEEAKPFVTAHDLILEYCTIHHVSYDSLKDAVIYYKSFSDSGTERIHNLCLVADDVSYMLAKELPNHQPTMQKTISGFVLNTDAGPEYKGNDIVFRLLTYDAKKYPRNDSINEGAIKFDPSVYDTGFALGLNLHVGYMTYEGATIDDAIMMNDRLVTEDRLSSVFIHQEDYEIERLEGKEEIFGFLDGKVPTGYSSNGLPLVGSHLSPGSPIINKYIMKMRDDGTIDYDSAGYTTTIDLPSTVGGQVVSAVITGGKKAVVTIVALAKAEVGDKLVGRYGNKGVIAKIVPNHLMPYDPATGRALDIILNPLGIPSRINVSQVLEVTYAACNRKQGTRAVVTPFQQGFIEKIKSDAEKLGIAPVRLVNPKTGLRTEYEVHVGEIYMCKLVHKVSSKLRSVGVTNEVDPTYKQPIGTGKTKAKGQASGELESWSNFSSGSFKVMEEIQTISSEDSEARKLAKKQIDESPGPVELDVSTWNNSNGNHLAMFHKASGIKMAQDPCDPSQIIYEPMRDEDIQGLNPMNPVNVTDIKNSLRNPRIFGDGKYASDDTWSWMPLGGEILNPFWIERAGIHYCIIVKSSSGNSYKSVRLRNIDVDNVLAGNLWLEEHVIAGSTEWHLEENGNGGGETGMQAMVNLFKRYDLKIAERYYEDLLKKSPADIDILQMLLKIRTLMKNDGLAGYVISSFPVVPIRYRPVSAHKTKVQDFDWYYAAIARCVVDYQQSRHSADLNKVYEYLQLFLGIAGKNKRRALMQDKESKYVDLKKYFTDKQSLGRARECLAKKRVHRSGRSVIVPFSDMSIPPTHLGVPYLMLIKIYEWELVALLKKKWSSVFSASHSEKDKDRLAAIILKAAVTDNEAELDEIAGKTVESKSKSVKEMVKDFAEKQIIIFGRQPSLHMFSERAFKIVAVDGKALQVHPLVCSGFNADFDGDTGYVIALFTVAACKEAWETKSVVHSIVNPGTGKLIIIPSQDTVLGMYYATSLEKNALHPSEVSPVFYNSLKTLLADLDLGIILPCQWVILKHKGSSYLSTAGRVAFNSLIPGGFTNRAYVDRYNLGIRGEFKSLRYDYVISGRVSDEKIHLNIESVYNELYEDYCGSTSGREQLIEYFHKINEFGFKWSERSGISFNLRDLEQSPLIKDFLKAADKVSAEIDRKFSMGLMTAEDRRKAVMGIYAEVRSKDFLQKYLSGFDRTNNIFMMFDSKAKGSEDQIMQTCGMLGVLQKTKEETLDAPITSNYTNGLSSFDLFQTSYSTRIGLLSTIMETRKPGELTRTLVYAFSGVCVTEDCCGGSQPIRIMYEKISDFLFLNEKRVKMSDVVGSDIVDALALTWDKGCGGTGKVTEQLLQDLAASGIPWFDTDIGRIFFDMKFPTFLEKLLLYRALNNTSYSDLIRYRYISGRTIKQIVKERPRFLDVMLIINCMCKDSICSESYGLRYASAEPIAVNSFPGVESAQSIGEPSAQLTMNLANKGGKAGESIGDGVSFMMSAIKEGNIKILNYGLASPRNGYVSIREKMLRITADDGGYVECGIKDEGTLLVRDGQYVTIGQSVIKGTIHPFNSFVFPTVKTKNGTVYTNLGKGRHASVLNPTPELIARIRYEIAALYNYVYSESRINILGRHFEIAAFSQTSHGTVIASTNPNYEPGKAYFVGELAQVEGIDYVLTRQKAKVATARNAGPITASMYQDAYNVISASMWSSTTKERGPLSAVFTGSSLGEKGLSIKNLSKEIDYGALKYVKKQDFVDKSVSEPVIVFSSADEPVDSDVELIASDDFPELQNEQGYTSADFGDELSLLLAELEQDEPTQGSDIKMMNKF